MTLYQLKMDPIILYEDNHIIAINKTAGLLTQPDDSKRPNAEEWLKQYLKEKHAKPGNVFLQAVHRIDKPTSGIVVFAKTSKGLSRLTATIRERQCTKTYWAIVEGKTSPPGGHLEHYLRHDDFYAATSTKEDGASKKAVLDYRCLNSDKSCHLIEIELATGRYHQIRAQFAAIGYPVVGDKKYSSKTHLPNEIIALHHRKMTLKHPTRPDLLTIEAATPSFWEEIMPLP